MRSSARRPNAARSRDEWAAAVKLLGPAHHLARHGRRRRQSVRRPDEFGRTNWRRLQLATFECGAPARSARLLAPMRGRPRLARRHIEERAESLRSEPDPPSACPAECGQRSGDEQMALDLLLSDCPCWLI